MGKLKELFEKWWNTASDEDKQHYYDELKHFNDRSYKTAWMAVNKDGQEVLIYSNSEPIRMSEEYWAPNDTDSVLDYDIVYVDNGLIENNIGEKLTWEDEPVEFT